MHPVRIRSARCTHNERDLHCSCRHIPEMSPDPGGLYPCILCEAESFGSSGARLGSMKASFVVVLVSCCTCVLFSTYTFCIHWAFLVCEVSLLHRLQKYRNIGVSDTSTCKCASFAICTRIASRARSCTHVLGVLACFFGEADNRRFFACCLRFEAGGSCGRGH